MGTHPIFESDFDCLTESRCGQQQRQQPGGIREKRETLKMVVEMENLSWDERRELRRQKRHKSLQAISRTLEKLNIWGSGDVPDRAQIQERRLKSQQKTEERKKKKEVLEAALNQEEKARLERQKRREEKRK